MKLEGRISGPWTAELDHTWHSLSSALDKRNLFIDLCGVSYIDREGRGILANIYRQTQAQFEANTPLTRYFAEEARTASFSNIKENSQGNGHASSDVKGEHK